MQVMLQVRPWGAPTRLITRKFPTADMMNEGTGLLAEREAKWQRAAHTAAYVSPQFQVGYTEPHVAGWLRSYAVTEQRFSEKRSARIPEDYLSRFECFLEKSHKACDLCFTDAVEEQRYENDTQNTQRAFDADTQLEWAAYCDVMYLQIECLPFRGALLPRELKVHQVFARPCAERFGFFRLVLNELARNCVYYGAILTFQDVAVRTQEITYRAWGGEPPRDSFVLRTVFSPQQLEASALKLHVTDYLFSRRKRLSADGAESTDTPFENII